MAVSLSKLGEQRQKALARYNAKRKKLRAKAKGKSATSAKPKAKAAKANGKANGKVKAASRSWRSSARKIKKVAKQLTQREPSPIEAALFGNSPE